MNEIKELILKDIHRTSLYVAAYNMLGTAYQLLTVDEWLHSYKLSVYGEEVLLTFNEVSII